MKTEFSKLRSFFWPVHKHELIKFVPMLALFFFISFNYHLLRITKDTLIITAPQSGAETIPFLKVWGILPAAIFLTFLFTKLSNRFNREKLFYVMMSIFLSFYIIFILFLYPNRELLYLHNTANYLYKILPIGFKGFIEIIRYWPYSLFYIMSESWSTIVFSILLWGFANDVIKVSEAKRFYALFGIGINSSGIFAGKCVHYITNKNNLINILHQTNLWDQSLLILIILILFFSLISCMIYRFLHTNIFPQRSSFPTKEKKPKMSLMKNISYIINSKYLFAIALIVLSYNLIINMTEILWKSQVKELFPSPREYTKYMSNVTFYIGMIATFASYFLSGNIIRKFGWKKTALITPIIITITGIGFFYFIFLNQAFPKILLFGKTPLILAVFFGTMQNILSRGSKYTVFDDTKEMAFIPLSPENKIKGKSAIDGIGSRLGKSGGSILIQLLLLIFATPAASVIYIAGIIFFTIPFWIRSINRVEKIFQKETSLSKV